MGFFEIEADFFPLVLPPIPTTSLTAADVHDISAHVRGVMLEALYEISRKDLSEKTSESRIVEQAVTSTDNKVVNQKEDSSSVLESIASPSIGVVPIPVETALSSDSVSSLASSSVSVGRDEAETEEDDEMVLVGRPKTN